METELSVEFINQFKFFADKIHVKKKEGHASDRVSAMVLGGAICSRENGKYTGPLFARKKTNYLGRFFVFMLVVGVSFSFWEPGRKKVLTFAMSFFKNDARAERSLASDAAADEKVELKTPSSEQKKYHKNER